MFHFLDFFLEWLRLIISKDTVRYILWATQILGLGPNYNYKFRAAVQNWGLFRGYLAASEESNGCEPQEGWLLLASSGWRAEMMLSFLQYTMQSPTTKDDSSIHSHRVENPGSVGIDKWMPLTSTFPQCHVVFPD